MEQVIYKREESGKYYIAKKDGDGWLFLHSLDYGGKARRYKFANAVLTRDIAQALHFKSETGADVVLSNIRNKDEFSVKRIHTEFTYVMD